MRFLASKSRDVSTEFYGKRGLSWSVTVAYVKQGDDYLARYYHHLQDQGNQNSETTAAILEDTLKRIKKEKPSITHAIICSDNAANYHSTQTIASLPSISARSGIKAKQWSFSESGRGKQVCDRISATAKRQLRMRVAEGSDITTSAEFIQVASLQGGFKAMSFHHGHTRTRHGPIASKKTITGISTFFDFTYNESLSELKAFKHLGIGSGQTINKVFWKNQENKKE